MTFDLSPEEDRRFQAEETEMGSQAVAEQSKDTDIWAPVNLGWQVVLPSRAPWEQQRGEEAVEWGGTVQSWNAMLRSLGLLQAAESL